MGESSLLSKLQRFRRKLLDQTDGYTCLESILFLMIMYGSVPVLVYLLFVVSLKFEWNADNLSQCLLSKLYPVTRLFTDRR